MGALNAVVPALPVEWETAFAPMKGEKVTGDLFIVKEFPAGAVVAAVDGIGHGEDAEHAAKTAIETIERFAAESPVAIIKHCHERLKRTRGAVMSVASFNSHENTLTWAGVGNIEGVLLRAGKNLPPRQQLLLYAGVVGYQMTQLHGFVLPVFPGDTLIFVTDGIHRSYVKDLVVKDPLKKLIARISLHALLSDDALIIAARYRGAAK